MLFESLALLAFISVLLFLTSPLGSSLLHCALQFFHAQRKPTSFACYKCSALEPRMVRKDQRKGKEDENAESKSSVGTSTSKAADNTFEPMQYEPAAECAGAGCSCVCHQAAGMHSDHSNKAAGAATCPAGMKGPGPFCPCFACGSQGPLETMKAAFLASRSTSAASTQSEFDVLILGGGIAALLQAHHLLLHAGRKIRIGIIEPRSPQRSNLARDYKVGESTVFLSGMFLARDLGLNDYLLEHHPIKHGLFYHWPKDPTRTESMNDYYSTHERGYPLLPSFQLDRIKFERDLTALCQQRGMVLFEGAAMIDEKFLKKPDNSEFYSVEYIPNATKDGKVTLSARHVIDAAGRNFLLGNLMKCVVRGPSADLWNIDNASVWVRVKHADYSRLFHSVESGQTTCRMFNSLLYATNHFLCRGAWLWVIPINTREGREISIGVSFHRQVYSMEHFDTVEKFYAFLKANHRILYDVCANAELVDFQKLNRLVHYSKQVITKDNLYIIGDASYNVDPFYSTGITTMARQIPLVSTVILGKLSGQMAPKDMNQLCDDYNAGLVGAVLNQIRVIYEHWRQLGNASVMSWRILLEVTAGVDMAGYASKWNQCPLAQRGIAASLSANDRLMKGVYDILSEIHEKGVNIGFADYNVPGLLPHFGAESALEATLLGTSVLGHPRERWISQGAYEFKRINIHSMAAGVQFRWLLSLLTVVYRGLGPARLLSPFVLSTIWTTLSKVYAAYWMGEKHERLLKKAGFTPNSEVTAIQQQFRQYICSVPETK